jgi:gliding motility-associated-like protein
LSIYNRWGEQIFRSADVSIGWDGSVSNLGAAPIGTYTYRVTYRFINGQDSQTINGHLNLIR